MPALRAIDVLFSGPCERALLRTTGPVLVGFSGGGDSMALLSLMTPLAERAGRQVVAAIVDHALRPESAGEAALAAERAERIGARARVVRLTWAPGNPAGQAKARRARYAALARVAGEIGSQDVFLGHTRDDQAETTLMALYAGSGRRGLAAMREAAPCPIWPEGRDLTLRRPLLGASRSDLRDFLVGRGMAWIEDPSNACDRFARVRARRVLANADMGRLLRVAERAATRAARLDRECAAFVKGAAAFADGCAEAQWERLRSVGEGAAARAVAVIAAAVSGAAREPSPRTAALLLARLTRTPVLTAFGAEWRRSGARLDVRRDWGAVVGRSDGAAGAAECVVSSGAEAVWDGRLAAMAAQELCLTRPGTPSPSRGPDVRVNGSTRALSEAAAAGVLRYRWLAAERAQRLLWRGFETAC